MHLLHSPLLCTEKMSSSGEKLCLKWNDFQENLKASFDQLREGNDFSDVTLVCDDGEVKAHKLVLSSCSPFFKRLLKKVKHPHQHPLVFMRGLNAGHLTNVVDFIYRGEANIHQEDLDAFLLLAQEFELKGLTEGTGDAGYVGDAGIMDDKQKVYSTNHKFETNQSKEIEQKYGNNIIKQSRQFGNEYENDHSLVPHDFNTNQNHEILQKRDTLFEKQNSLWTCKVCGFASIQRGHLAEHVEKHMEGLEFPCKLCGKLLRSTMSFRVHKTRCQLRKRLSSEV